MNSDDNLPFIPYGGVPYQAGNNLQIVRYEQGNPIAFKQSLSDFNINPNIDFLISEHGSSLLDILSAESLLTMGTDNTPQLKAIYTGNPQADATRIMGSLSEAIVVQACNNNQEINRELGKIARGANRVNDVLDNYVAISTGSQQTKIHYNQFYNPSDTQRDLIWVDKNNTQLQLNSIIPNAAPTSVKPAGLQIKTSHDHQYVMSNIKQYHYPILFFDLSNDWYHASLKSMHINYESGTYVEKVRLIPHNDITLHLKEIIKSYFNIIKQLVTGEISIQHIIDLARWKGDKILGGALQSSTPDSGSIIIT